MPERNYRIKGRVIDRAARSPVPGVRVEVWDRDTRYHNMLGVATTNARGEFLIAFDETYFGDFAPDRAPDVYAKVFLDERLVLNTFESPLHDLRDGDTEVTLQIDLGDAGVAGRDRVTSEQMFKVLTFVQRSDFVGVYREGRDKVTTVGKFAGGVATRWFQNVELQPIAPSGVRTNEIVGQDVQTASTNLASRNVTVGEVRRYDALVNREGLRAIADFPLTLKADDQVVLYEEQGTVRYYSLIRKTKPVDVNAATVTRLEGEVTELKSELRDVATVRAEVKSVKASSEQATTQIAEDLAAIKPQVEEVARLKRELQRVQQASAEKDAQLEQLRTELKTVREQQDDFTARISPEKLNQLEERLAQLSERIERAPSGSSRTPQPSPDSAPEPRTPKKTRRKPDR